MDIAQLKQTIEDALKQQPFTVTGALLESQPVTLLFTNFFGSDSFTLDGAHKISETNDEIVVGGQMTQQLVGLPDLQAAATFEVSDGQVEIHVRLTNLPANWSVSDSFPNLKASVFDEFIWGSPVLSLDSAGYPALPANFPVGFGYPAYSSEIEAAMIYGLGLQADVKLVSGGGPLEWLLSGTKWTVSGPVVLPSSQVSIALATAPQTGVEIGTLTIPFSLNLAAVALKPKPEDSSIVTSTIQLDAEVDKEVGGGGSTLRIPVVMREQSAAAQILTIATAFPPDHGLAVGDIAALIGRSIAGQVPPDFPASDDIQLEQVALAVAPTSEDKLLSLSATVGWKPKQPYRVLGDLITFDGMSVTFTYLPAGYGRPDGSISYVETSVDAQATIADGTLSAELLLPDLVFSCELAEGTSIDITKMVRDAVGETISMPQVNCTELSVYGDISGNTYRFDATVTDDWVFHIGSTPLALTEIGMDITKDPQGFSGEVTCQFTIAQTQLYGRAAYDSASGGWQFQVGTLLPTNVNLTDLAADILKLLGLNLTSNAPTLSLTAINFSFDTATKDFQFECATTLEIAGVTAELGLHISKDAFAGLLWVGDSYFDIDFNTADQKKTLTAKWQATDEQGYLEFADLARLLGLPPPTLPDGLDLRLAAASLTYGFSDGQLVITADSQTYGKAIFVSTVIGGKTEYFAALNLGHPIELSNLPLLDELLSPSQTFAIADLHVVLSSGNISAADAQTINQIIQSVAPGYPTLPAQGMAGPVGLGATLDFGGNKFPLSLGIADPSRNGGQSTANSTTLGPQSGTNQGSVTPTPPAASDGTTWFNVQKSFGPVTFGKVGVRYSEGTLWFLLNASVSFGGLSLTLQGASVGSPVKSFSPRFDLQGLGLDYYKPPVEIGGGFTKVKPTGGATFEYDGTVVVKMPEWGLAAFGTYAEVNGEPSMFIFAQVQGTFGGPPAFFITGILGGFGYNSALRIPGQQEVIDCPLVAGLTDPSIVGGNNATPTQALTKLTGGPNPWVTHSLGEMWIAAGLMFTTYELLSSTALLVVEFGNDLTIALLGVSTARFPPEPQLPAYAQIQLQLEAVLQPTLGFFGISANLTRNSFLIDPACVLTGGFAFYLWFSPNEYAGDFVVTLGGYNPNFDPPKWYPSEPRVGFSWTLDSTISINGGAYFALTPSAAMAGGGLSIVFHAGNLKAWFTAHADLIVWWKPFHFIVSIGVSIGASYKMDLLFTSVTLTVELGANLDMWGPPTGGTATVHWYVISFTVTFGQPPTAASARLDWNQFEGLLPPGGDAVKITPVDGLAAQQTEQAARAARLAATDTPPAADKWVVRSGRFSFTTRASIPASEMFVGSKSEQPHFTGDKLNIRPMQEAQLASTHRLSMTRNGEEFDPLAEGWTLEAATANVPKALWGAGDGSKLDPGDDQLVTNQLTGFLVEAPPPSLGYTAGAIDVADDLSYDPLSPDGTTPIVSGLGPTGDVPVSGSNTILIMQQEIATTAQAARDGIYSTLVSLGVDPGANGPLGDFAARAGRLFTNEPLIVPTA